MNGDQLISFYEVARYASFSKGAENLGISQPALSIRIRKLEEFIQNSLFVRSTHPLQLTEIGEKLFKLCQEQLSREQDFLSEVMSVDSPFVGRVSIAGFSTIMNSILIPSLSQLVSSYPQARVDTLTLEMYELRRVLQYQRADYVISSEDLKAST